MNRSPNYILAAVVIASLVCALLMPVASAALGIQTTTTGGVKPSSCYSAPKYPVPAYDIEPVGSAAVSASGLTLFDGPPYSVQFHDLTPAPATSQTIASRYWNFGDGSTSTVKDPVHTYAGPGSYNALLSVTTICGSQYTTKVVIPVNTYCTNPVHGFTVDVYEGPAPLTVHVTDTSKRTPAGVTTWTYTKSTTSKANYMYEYGSVSLERNPVFTFDTPGTYTITQRITKSCTDPEAGTIGEKPSVVAAQIRVTSETYSAEPGGRISQTATTVTSETPGDITMYAAATTTAPALSSSSVSFPQDSTGAAAAMISPGTGTISVTTDPAGASVWVDDVKWGVSPATIPGLAAGSHTLRLEKAGYQNISVPVTVPDGTTAGYSLALEPVSGSGAAGMLPLVAGVLVVIAIGGAGLYLFTKKKKAP